MKTVLSYGAGTNSVAILVGLKERGEKVDYIVFCDTGGERPETYEHIKTMNIWCKTNNFPEIIQIKGTMPQQKIDGSLEQECLRLNTLPSKAFGFGSCSHKWKILPFNTWAKQEFGEESFTRLIGFDIDEEHRAARPKNATANDIRRYPLIEWLWDRQDCISAIKREGLILPGKSACFFCPSTKKEEIFELQKIHPDLFERALFMEKKALDSGKLTSTKGLGRSKSWVSIVEKNNKESCDFISQEIECGCFDG